MAPPTNAAAGFLDANNNLHFAAGSAAINAGDPSSYPSHDIDGQTRPHRHHTRRRRRQKPAKPTTADRPSPRAQAVRAELHRLVAGVAGIPGGPSCSRQMLR